MNAHGAGTGTNAGDREDAGEQHQEKRQMLRPNRRVPELRRAFRAPVAVAVGDHQDGDEREDAVDDLVRDLADAGDHGGALR